MSTAATPRSETQEATAKSIGAEPFGAAWTGAQWSAARIVFGLFLLVRLTRLVDPFAPFFATTHVLVAIGLFASVALLIGAETRVSAGVLLVVGVWLAIVRPWASAPRMLIEALPLIACMLAPPEPFGSFAARGRVDPDGGWRLPARAFAILWIGVALSCAWSSITKLTSPSWREGNALAHALWNPGSMPASMRDLLSHAPLWTLRTATFLAFGAGLLFAPLAAFRKTRPLAWSVLFALHLAALPVARLRDGHLAMVVVLLFLFDPAWLPPRRGRVRDFVFFDGTCGLCHRLVRFVLVEDRTGIFEMSPLQGLTVKAMLSDDARAHLPDSVVVRDAGGRILLKSDAVIHVYRRLGGMWRAVAVVLRCIPRPLRNLGYDLVAKLRHRLFPRPADSCPLMPPSMKDRFVA